MHARKADYMSFHVISKCILLIGIPLTFVVIWPSKQKGQKMNQIQMQFGDVTNILYEKVVDVLIWEDKLIELGYHFLEKIVASDLFEESRHGIR